MKSSNTPRTVPNLPAPGPNTPVYVPMNLWESYVRVHRLKVVHSWWDEREHRICIEVLPAGADPQQTEASNP